MKPPRRKKLTPRERQRFEQMATERPLLFLAHLGKAGTQKPPKPLRRAGQ
jgi:hypothetical protein